MVPLGQTRFLQLSLQMVAAEGIRQTSQVLLLAVDPEVAQVTQKREHLEQPIKDMLVETAQEHL
jgi:hypothetical protein